MIKVVSRHEDTKLYGAILPDELTNEAIKDSKPQRILCRCFKKLEPPKTNASIKKKKIGSNKTKTPPTAKGKRLKTSTKVAKPAKKKQLAKMFKAKGLTVLSEVALTKAEQMDLATKRILIQTHKSHASGSVSDEEDDDEVAMSNDDGNDDDVDNQDDDDNDDDDQNDDNTDNENDDNDDDDDGQDQEGQDDDNEQTDSDNNGDDFVHPKFSTHDEKDNEEEGSDLRVQTPSHYESTDEEERRNVLVTTIAEPPLLSATTLPPPTIPFITHLQQTPAPTPTTVPLVPYSVSLIPGIVDTYLANKMHEAVKIAIQLQSDRLRDEKLS
ncbi:hypothetical protein Tco_0651807 [Tanacetum coccineum]|uniref:Uncharacterized protein n=1 Tax=Tanacetum coccineum TaxID=301880 RepID=A0ABQ4WW47_9ASTR